MDANGILSRCTLGRGWTLTSTTDLGATSKVYTLSDGRGLLALKTARSPNLAETLRAEHRLLRALGRTAMAPFVPAAGPWLHDLCGFTMTWLRYPTHAEAASPAWRASLARVLRTLHALPVPEGLGVPDDRPTPGTAYGAAVRRALDAVTGDPAAWRWLRDPDRGFLEQLRALAPAYAALVPQMEIFDTEPATLIHGDLAGDNLMAFADGAPALADWGMARIGARWTDVAALAVYSEWDAATLRAFLDVYQAGNGAGIAAGSLEPLLALTRYRVCVDSLKWVNQPPGEATLDAVGRAFFERQMACLS